MHPLFRCIGNIAKRSKESTEVFGVAQRSRRVAQWRLASAVGVSLVVLGFVAMQSTSGPLASAERTPAGITPSGASDNSREAVHPFPHIEINEPAPSSYVVSAAAVHAKPKYAPVVEVPDPPDVTGDSVPSGTTPTPTTQPPDISTTTTTTPEPPAMPPVEAGPPITVTPPGLAEPGNTH